MTGGGILKGVGTLRGANVGVVVVSFVKLLWFSDRGAHLHLLITVFLQFLFSQILKHPPSSSAHTITAETPNAT